MKTNLSTTKKEPPEELLSMPFMVHFEYFINYLIYNFYEIFYENRGLFEIEMVYSAITSTLSNFTTHST